jgi:7,8-dihydropterin-6-yl-methyl-4-(beta-D-ribofuranosyl)aminobenzene 5'-phosphate synthase
MPGLQGTWENDNVTRAGSGLRAGTEKTDGQPTSGGETMTRGIHRCLWLLAALLFVPGLASADKAEITVLYDAFGKPSDMRMDWGFAAFVEYGGKRILFDAGNNAEIFAHNVKAKGIDLTSLDFVVMSHRHGDHTSGLNYLMEVNPDVKIYAPRENFGVFGAALPGTFFRRNENLSSEMRYYGGNPPERMEFGTPWPQGDFEWLAETTEVAPGFHVIVLKGPYGVDLDVIEMSLAIETEDGIVLVVGCSHPTIEKIVETAREKIQGKPVHLIVGGTHLLPAKDDEIHRIANTLRDDHAVRWLAAAHCTGEPAFEILQQAFGDRYLYAGLGTTLTLGPDVQARGPDGEIITAALMSQDERLTYQFLLANGHDAHLSALARQGDGHSPHHHHHHAH